MNKIKTLLEKAGCNQDLVGSICEALEDYKTTLREQYDSDYQNRVEQAKKVCIEETEAHKRELARRVQIFCETKAAAIEAQLAKQSALSESEAVTRLKNVMSLLEGIEPNGEPNGQATAALDKAKLKIQQVNEERTRAVEVANRQVAISEKALKENRRLAAENAQLKQRLGTVSESRQTQGGRKRIDVSRTATHPVTTRQTLLENQDRRQPQRKASPVQTQPQRGFNIGDIAEGMDEDLI